MPKGKPNDAAYSVVTSPGGRGGGAVAVKLNVTVEAVIIVVVREERGAVGVEQFEYRVERRANVVRLNIEHQQRIGRHVHRVEVDVTGRIDGPGGGVSESNEVSRRVVVVGFGLVHRPLRTEAPRRR